MIPIRDFSNRKAFPGTIGNPFDILLHRYAQIESLPAVIFFLILGFLAAVASFAHWPRAVALLLFFVSDWILLALLPKMGKSFGPPKPPLLLLAIARSLFGWLPSPAFWIIEAIGTLLVVYGFWIEPHRLTTTFQKLSSKKLAPGTSIRILHLGDLHIERITDRERKVLAQIERLQPDLILFSGDVLNLSYLKDPQAIEDARWFLSQCQARCGSYAVSGSPAVDLEDLLPRLYEGMPVHLLENVKRTIEIDGNLVDIIGVHCSHKPFVDAPILEKLAPASPGHFSILLYHSPDLAPNAAALGIDLQFSGHTHGGQVRIPFFGPLFTASLYGRAFQSGRYQLGNLMLYITRGIGMEGAAAPRVRLFCPPEIILWEITSTQEEA